FAQRFKVVPTATSTPTPTPTITPTATDTPPPATCAATPRSGCTAASKSILKLKNSGSSKKLLWKWLKGSIPTGGFGDPTFGSNYRLCVYDGTTLKMNPALESGFLWQPTSSGAKYQNPDTNADGFAKAILKTGTGSAKILLKGKGSNLALPLPITA